MKPIYHTLRNVFLKKNLQYWDFVAIFADTKAINGI